MPATCTPKPKKRTAPAARPARTRGQIIQKDARKWLVRFFIERDARTGKRRYGATTIEGTRRDAERELTKRLADVDAGTYRAPSKLTLADYLREWLAERAVDVRTGALAPRMLEDYQRAAAKIVPLFGALALDAIGKRDVADVKRALMEQFEPAAAQRAFDVSRIATCSVWR